MKFFLIKILSIVLISKAYAQSYKEIKIGRQVWMAENLNVSTFRNGDSITQLFSFEEWKIALQNHQPAWCFINSNSVNNILCGKWYNFYAVTDPRGLAPEGWHIPALSEWDVMVHELGGKLIDNKNDVGIKLKSKDWWNKKSTNDFGFSAVPCGACAGPDRIFDNDKTAWWTTTGFYVIGVSDQSAIQFEKVFEKGIGISVRCIKD